MVKKRNGILDSFRKSILLLPSVAIMAVFFILPILLAFFYSFTNLALSGSNAKNFRFIGLDNYARMLGDPAVTTSIINTLLFLLGSLVGQQLLGFLIASLMKNRNKVFRSVVGPIVLAGWVMPEIVVALCASAFFDDSGTLNAVLGAAGIPPVAWLYEHPMLSVILANIWHGTAFSMMIFQAALDDVPHEIEEAARVDGANRFQTLIHIILPCIRNTIATNTILNTLQTLGVFGLIYAMTGGGPGMATNTLPIFMYNQAFVNYQLGYGTAISMILLVLGILLSVLYTRLMGQNREVSR